MKREINRSDQTIRCDFTALFYGDLETPGATTADFEQFHKFEEKGLKINSDKKL